MSLNTNLVAKIALPAAAVACAMLLAASTAHAAPWMGYDATDAGGYYGNTVTVNGANELIVGTGPTNGFNFGLNGVNGHVFQGRANISVPSNIRFVQATFRMPQSNAIGLPSNGKNAYDSWLSVRALTYPAAVEQSGDAGFFFTSSNGNLGDMIYANTRLASVNVSADNPELPLARFAAGSIHSLGIFLGDDGRLTYSIDGVPFHTSVFPSPTFAELGTIQLGGGYFVPGSTGSAMDVPSRDFEFTNFVAVVPEPATLGCIAAVGIVAGRRRRSI